MKKKIILLGILLLIIIGIVIIIPLFNNDPIRNQLVLYGFEASSDDNFYSKQLSKGNYDEYMHKGTTYDNLSFSFDNYSLYRNYMFNSDNVDTTYNFIYDYNKNIISFTARYVYEYSNIVLNGRYNVNNNIFYCNSEVEYLVDLDTLKDELCSEVNEYIIETKEISDNVFDQKTLKILKEKSES